MYIRAYTETYTAGFSFDFIVVYNYSEEIRKIVERITEDAFKKNGCEVTSYDLGDVTDLYVESDPKRWGEFDVFQVTVDFESNGDYPESKIIRDLEIAMKNSGYSVIGNPEFYSFD